MVLPLTLTRPSAIRASASRREQSPALAMRLAIRSLGADLSNEKLEEIKDYAWHAFSTLGCKNWGRVDFIEDEEGNFQIIEVNTVPGLTEKSLFPKAASYAGLSFDEVVMKVLQLSCK